ncbi:methyltransferase domain-containing protein [Asanoa sp. WMMD1127]|uniref:class I SAM-dependent methyltransferase n=1 Tax=Asanoa sp. WMMD1127 TaxID=3016107 RepID=UPI002418051C|nr:class I SAM-dependent methyltransferase [Asanoa sp. WMMD1127]MDG4824764.1 methyltransferase domain-containing protein [Asanoa sp. WMMD1127]
MASVYDSERLAAAYAFDRPPLHPRILGSAGLAGGARRALDVGCGAGLSTAALAPYARDVVGVEPVPAMLTHARTVAPHARFVVAAAECLPFASGSFDLVTAAGSLNYADLPVAFGEAGRVLTPDGRLVVYDFFDARRTGTGDALANWFAAFEARFPFPPGWRPLDVRELPLTDWGWRLVGHTRVEARLPMTYDAYLRYTFSGVNVDDAIARGVCTAREAHEWCRDTLEPVFARGALTVLVPGYVASAVKLGGDPSPRTISGELMSADDEAATPDETATPEEGAEEETPVFANRAERRAKGKSKGSNPRGQGSGGFVGKGGTFQPPRNYGNRRSG